MHPLCHVPRHMVEPVGTLALFVRIDRRENGNFMDVMLPEHGQFWVGHRVAPRIEITLWPSRGLLPFGFCGQSRVLDGAKFLGFIPCHVQSGPPCQSFVLD